MKGNKFTDQFNESEQLEKTNSKKSKKVKTKDYIKRGLAIGGIALVLYGSMIFPPKDITRDISTPPAIYAEASTENTNFMQTLTATSNFFKDSDGTKIIIEDNITNIGKLEKYKEGNVTLIDIGDYKHIGIPYLDSKLERLHDKQLDFGLIVSSKADDLEYLYRDMDLVKQFVYQYSPTYPVYLNIDDIMTNTSLTTEDRTKIIQAFINKCATNGIKAGIKGYDKNLCILREDCQVLGDFEVYVVMDQNSEEIKYSGEYSIYTTSQGKTYLMEDLSKETKGLNSPQNLVTDKTYTFKEGDDINEIASKTGMSAEEIAAYNNTKVRKIKPGTTITIPSEQTTTPLASTLVESPSEQIDGKLFGVDMSYSQDYVDWPTLKENVDYVILRTNHGVETDKNFENFYKNCQDYNIPVGFYCFNEYTAVGVPNIEDFMAYQYEQAEKVLELLKDKDVKTPVYLDIEDNWNGKHSLKEQYPPEYIDVMLEIWYSEMTRNGYTPGIYSNPSAYRDIIQSSVNYPLNERFDLWRAGGPKYGQTVTMDELPEVIPEVEFSGDNLTFSICQITDEGSGIGAGNSKDHVDINVSNGDFLDKSEKPKESGIKNLNAESGIRKIKEVARDFITTTALVGTGIAIPILAEATVGTAKAKTKGKKPAH